MTSGKSLANQEQASDSKTVFLIGIAVLCCTARRFSCECTLLQPSQDQVVPKELPQYVPLLLCNHQCKK